MNSNSLPLNSSNIINKRRVIVFHGLPGVGKTTLANELRSELLNYILLSSSALREEHNLIDIFSITERKILFKLIGEAIEKVVSKGNNNIIIDCNLFIRTFRETLLVNLKNLQFDIYYFLLEANEKDLIKRLNNKIQKDNLYSKVNYSPQQILHLIKNDTDTLSQDERKLIKILFQYNTSSNKVQSNSSGSGYLEQAIKYIGIIKRKRPNIHLVSQYNQYEVQNQ